MNEREQIIEDAKKSIPILLKYDSETSPEDIDEFSTDEYMVDVFFKFAELQRARAQPAQEPVAYNHHFMDEYDLMPEEVLSHSAEIPAISGYKYAGMTDKLYTTPPSEAARIAELEAKLAECEKDAERYRFLRDEAHDVDYRVVPQCILYEKNNEWIVDRYLCRAELDKLTDQAIADKGET